MKKLLIILILSFVNLFAEPAPVYVEPTDKGYQVRVSANDEQFKVWFPEEPVQVGSGKNGQIVYVLDKEDKYRTRYLFAYIYNPEERGYPMRVLWRYPSIGMHRLNIMRKEVVDRIVGRMMAFSGMGREVVAKEVEHRGYPQGSPTQGEYYQYEVLLGSPYQPPIEVTFRVYIAREGIYLIAMIGEDVHRAGYDSKFPLADWRWHIPFLWPREYGLRLVPFLWPERWRVKSTRDWLTWGKYGPAPFFEKAELIFKEG